MVKRPLIWILSGYMAGICCALDRNNGKKILILSTLLFYLTVSILFVYEGRKNFKYDSFLIIIPIVMVIGFNIYLKQVSEMETDSLINGKLEVSAKGILYKIEHKQQSQALYIKNTKLLIGKKIYSIGKIIVYNNSANYNLKIGNQILVNGKISKFQRATNPGQFDELKYYKTKWINYKMFSRNINILNKGYNYFYQNLYEIRKHINLIYKKILPNQEAGIISAMILGEKEYLNEDIKELYKRNGISHILAISGLHISLVGMCIFKILRKCLLNINISSVITIIIIFSYGLLTGFSVSTNRAVVMIIITLGALVLGRTYDMISSLSLSGLIILIQSPMELFGGSFLLSFSAVLAIIIILPIFNEVLENKKFINIFCVSTGISIFNLPIILYLFYEVPIYSTIINVIIIPFMSILVLLGLGGGIIGCFNIVAGRFLLGGVYYILNLYKMVCEFFENLPWNVILFGQPDIFLIMLYYVIIIFTYIFVIKMKKKKAIIILIFLFSIFIRNSKGILEITFLDVGQGDCIFMRTPYNETYLIDGGSSDIMNVGKYRITPFLKSKGIDTINYIIITHADLDHVSGIKELISNNEINIKNIFIPVTEIKDEAYMDIINMAEDNKILIGYINRGDGFSDRDISIRSIYPDKGYIAESRNDYSAVINVKFKEFSVLFTGDIEKKGEEELIKSGCLSDIDVLKIAHHGSDSSTIKEFLKIVKPEISVISCGENNKYGHPHKNLIGRLEEAETSIYITKDSGAVTIKTDGKRVFVEKMVD